MVGDTVISGVGNTVMLIKSGSEKQLPDCAVMVKSTVCELLVVLVSVPEIVAPLPEFGKPVTFTVLFLVQLKVVPATLFGFEIAIEPKGELPQRVCESGKATTVGFGFTVMLTVVLEESQPAAVAIIVKIVVCGTLVVLVKVPEMLEEVPEVAMPVRFEVLSRVQLYVVPKTAFGLVRLMVLIAISEQTVWLVGAAATVGFGFTNTEAITGLAVHPSSETAFKVKLTVCTILVVLVKLPEMTLPVPLAAIPVTFAALSRVQL